MTRVENILKAARLTLADLSNQRWDDDALLYLLDEAQRDFCQQTKILSERVEVPIFVGTPYFYLPDDCWYLSRVLHNNRVLPLVTHRELDERGSVEDTLRYVSWEDETGTPEAIVYDKRKMLEGKVYPIPDKGDSVVDYSFVSGGTETFYTVDGFGLASLYVGATLVPIYGVVSDAGSLVETIELSNLYGITSALTVADPVVAEIGFGVVVALDNYEFSSLYGITVDIESPDIQSTTFSSDFGICVNVQSSCTVIKCYYLQNPSTIDALDSELSTPPMYDIALKFYVVGNAFLNDLDAASQQKASQQLMIYERHVNTAKEDSAKNFSNAGQFHTTYRRGV